MLQILSALALLAAGQDDAFERACLEWAKLLDAECRIDDPLPAIDSRWDQQGFAERTLRGIPQPDLLLPGYRKGNLESGSISESIHQNTRDGGSYRFLRLRKSDGRVRALFRMVAAKGGFNYHEYLLAAGPDGRVRIEDLIIHLTGIPLSETLRLEFLRQLAEKDDVLPGLPAALQAEVERDAAVRRFTTLASATGDARRVLKAWEELPEAVRRNPRVLLARFQRAATLGNDDAVATAEDLLRLTGESSMACLQTLAVLGNAGRRDRALEVLDRLEAHFGGSDANLLQNRAELFGTDRNAEAEAMLRKAIAAEPDVSPAHWSLLARLVRRKDHAGTAQALAAIERHLEVRIKNLAKLEGYGDFVKSPQHEAWLASRQSKSDKEYDLGTIGSISPLGQAVDFRTHQWHDIRTTMRSVDRIVKDDRRTDAHSFVGAVEVLALDGIKPARQRVRFTKAQRRESGEEKPYGFVGKDVIVSQLPGGEESFTYEDGAALSAEDLKGVRKALHKSDDKDPDDDVFAPPKPLKVGESWNPDPAKVLRSFEMEDMGADLAQVVTRFTLARVEPRGGAEYASVDALIRIPTRTLGPMKLASPMVFQMAMEIRARVDVPVEDIAVKMSGSIRGDSAVELPGVQDARLSMEGVMGGRTIVVPRK